MSRPTETWWCYRMLRDGEVVFDGGMWRTEREAWERVDSLRRHMTISSAADHHLLSYEVYQKTDGIDDLDWARQIIGGFLASHDMWVTPPEELVAQARQYLEEVP